MKVLLINPPIRLSVPPYFQPVGLAIIAQVLLDAGHEVEILDINCLRLNNKHIDLPKGDYDFVGIGGLITTYRFMYQIMPMLRETYDAPIVIGGGGITSSPKVFMENLNPDYGVIGEGEYTMLELVSGKPKEEILGLAYGDTINPPRPVETNLDNFPSQAFHLLDMEAYSSVLRHNIRANGELAVLATRGCPRNCSFCYHVFGRGVRYRSVEKVIEEIEFLHRTYNTHSFLLGDECFTADKDYVLEFCNAVKGLGVTWTCLSRVDTIDEEMMIAMKDAGCLFVGFGLESGSQKMLNEMQKGVTVEQNRSAYELAGKHFGRAGGTMIYGMPGENDETIEETVEFCKSVGHKKIFFYLAPYPGTKVYNDNLDKILARYGSEHEYFMCLGDAAHPVINLTDYPDDVYHIKKKDMEWRIHEQCRDTAKSN